MAEITEEQISFLDQFASMLTDNVDWSSAPQTMQEDYTSFTQLIEGLKNNAAPQQDTGSTGGPLGGAEIAAEDMKKMRDMAASMVQMMDNMMGSSMPGM